MIYRRRYFENLDYQLITFSKEKGNICYLDQLRCLNDQEILDFFAFANANAGNGEGIEFIPNFGNGYHNAKGLSVLIDKIDRFYLTAYDVDNNLLIDKLNFQNIKWLFSNLCTFDRVPFVFNNKIDFSKSFIEYAGNITDDEDINFLFYVNYAFKNNRIIERKYELDSYKMKSFSVNFEMLNADAGLFKPVYFDHLSFDRSFFDSNKIKGIYISHNLQPDGRPQPIKGYINIVCNDRNNLYKDMPLALLQTPEAYQSNPNVFELNNVKINYDESYIMFWGGVMPGKIFDINFIY
jgi:hypothetical protein